MTKGQVKLIISKQSGLGESDIMKNTATLRNSESEQRGHLKLAPELFDEQPMPSPKVLEKMTPRQKDIKVDLSGDVSVKSVHSLELPSDDDLCNVDEIAYDLSRIPTLTKDKKMVGA